MITASQLYDYVQCPHRVYLDIWGDRVCRSEPSAFVQLLWEQGLDHEVQIVATLGVTADMSSVPYADRERETRLAIQRGEPLIYQGLLTSGDRLGSPDLLERRGKSYVAGDIKSGAGLDGDDGTAKLKKHYAVQVAHYANILEREGLGAGHEAFVIDRDSARVAYLLDEQRGTRETEAWWDIYLDVESRVRALQAQTESTLPALSATCKLCHWYAFCKEQVIASDDLTLIAELGRSKRDAMIRTIPTVHALANSNPHKFIQGKKTSFAGIGPDALLKFHTRAKLLTTPGAKPYLKKPVALPVAAKEVYFDIEADPMRDMVYLHGFVERQHAQPGTARFIPFCADGIGLADEEKAFCDAWSYLAARAQDSVIYYYSKYERTAYRKLAAKYPAVCTTAQVNNLFAQPAMVDLYFDIVKPATEWPTCDQSIKTLAQFLGFHWRDSNPSGAASIEWYHRWIETGDPAIMRRILEYNEDDCLATGVLADGIRALWP